MSDQQDYQEYLQDLGKIRQLMEQSTRFFSLSGLSGVFAGTYALIGAAVAYYVLNDSFWDFGRHWRQFDGIFISDQVLFIMADAMGVLFLSLATGYFFSSRKAQKSGESLWNKVALRMVLNLFIPLIGGGFFCLALIYHQATFMVPSATLLFYGIALLNASKYFSRAEG
ncbi:MAG: hypothetical protein AAGB22_15090, partial [Bacteroidota bacterium]